jgi:hypothetical protein
MPYVMRGAYSICAPHALLSRSAVGFPLTFHAIPGTAKRALAKEPGKFDRELQYPAEDSVYEKPKMDKLGL